MDTAHPAILSDPKINWITEPIHASRVTRGLTPAGKRGRGMGKRGRGSEHTRPSVGKRISRRSIQRTPHKINKSRGVP